MVLCDIQSHHRYLKLLLAKITITKFYAAMDIRLLEAFRAVIETGSVTHAAAALGVTQPAVSAQIARLEGVLGFSLFERFRQPAAADGGGDRVSRRGRQDARPDRRFGLCRSRCCAMDNPARWRSRAIRWRV